MNNTVKRKSEKKTGIKERLKSREVLLYIFFGILTTIVSFAAYFLFRWLLPAQNTSPAVFLSWVCAVTFAYLTNRLFVFKSRSHGTGILKEAALFYAARILTLFVDLLMMFLLVDLTGLAGRLYEFMARCFVSIIILTLNYIISKFLIFKKQK